MKSPQPYLTIGKTLYPYRGFVGIKQYNPNKSAKYGFLYHSLRNAILPYMYYTLPYAGEPSKRNNEVCKYYILGTGEYTKYVVNGLNY